MNDSVQRRSAIRFKALNLLSQREHGCQELQQKLSKYYADQDESVIEVCRQLKDEGLLSDERFVESFVNGRINKGQGPVKITMELKQRGVDEALVSDRIAGNGFDWVELARQVRVKKFGNQMPDSYQARAKIARFLNYRGFSHDHINACLESEESAFSDEI